MVRHIMSPGPRLEGALYVLLLAKVIGLEAAIGLALVGVPILIGRGLMDRAS